MNLIVRIDSHEIDKRLSSSIIYGSDQHLKKMLKLCKLSSSSATREMLAALDFFPTVLLYGPPNTGKTTLAYRLFRKLKESNNNTNLYSLSFSKAMSSEYGETSKNITKAFEELVENIAEDEFRILLIDEIDQFCISRTRVNEHDASRRAMSVLMLELDKIHPANHSQILVVAMTNVQDSIDSAVTRRFSLKLKVNEKLSQTDFEDYIKNLVKCIDITGKNLKLRDDQVENLFNVYTSSKITIPDIKGVFRGVIIGDTLDQDKLYPELEHCFKSAYSSIANKLESDT